jgi:hypothetical protein
MLIPAKVWGGCDKFAVVGLIRELLTAEWRILGSGGD